MTRDAVRARVSALAPTDALILGCTHHSFLIEAMRAERDDLAYLDPAAYQVARLRRFAPHRFAAPGAETMRTTFVTSGSDLAGFRAQIQALLRERDPWVERREDVPSIATA